MNRMNSSDDALTLRGRRAWIFSDGKAGHEIQCRGVAAALGVEFEIRRVSPSLVGRLTAPWGLPGRDSVSGDGGGLLRPPWPDIAFAAGRLTIPYIRALKRKAGLGTYTVVLLDPRMPANCADLIWLPEHDARRGANVVATLTSPHGFSEDRLATLRATLPDSIARLPHPRVAVLIGGPNGAYSFGADDAKRLGGVLRELAASGAGLMISSSRRTPAAFLAEIERATAAAPRILFDGKGDNPYADFLAHADAFIVTADSVNMAGEAAATGKPIHVFELDGGGLKFSRFHAGLRASGAARPLRLVNGELENWRYEPINSAVTIAEEIERRWLARRQLIPGLVGKD